MTTRHSAMALQDIELSLTVAAILAAISLVQIIRTTLTHRKAPRISVLDTVIALWLGYSIFNIVFVRKAPLPYETWASLISISAIYLICRNVRHKIIIAYGIIAYAIFEATVAYLQLAGYVSSNHYVFAVTGTFGNPSLLGGVLAVGLVAITGIAIYNVRGRPKFSHCKYDIFRQAMQITIALFICGALVLSDSRASWLAAITGIGCIAYRRICERFSKITAVASFIVIIAAAAVAMYYYKQPSADGRLFIWKISVDMIAEAPITGHGTGTFAAKYMYSQADYFASNNNAAAVIDVADNTIYPYNEFLRITAEQGIIGLIFFIIIAVFIIQNISKCDNDRIYAAMYISLMIFSSFSYPFSAMEVAILLPLIAGSVKSKVLIDRPLNRTTVAGAICLLSSITALRNSYDNELAAIADGTYADLRITQSPNFMRRLSVDILDETNCIKINEILRIAADIIPSCELLCDLGNSYRNLGMPEMADSCYLLAHKMIPNRIMPLYQRFALYKSTDDIANARRIADEILSTKFKIAGTKTIAIKAEVSEFMQLSEYSKKIPKPIIYHHCIKDKGDY